MKYLIDTGIWLWAVTSSELIGIEGLTLLKSGRAELYFSAASVWEISIKWALHKLDPPQQPVSYVPRILSEQGIRPLPITCAHALAVSEMPLHHADPFDRLLIAQAQTEDMVILTADRAFKSYEVEILWCGQ